MSLRLLMSCAALLLTLKLKAAPSAQIADAEALLGCPQVTARLGCCCIWLRVAEGIGGAVAEDQEILLLLLTQLALSLKTEGCRICTLSPRLADVDKQRAAAAADANAAAE